MRSFSAYRRIALMACAAWAVCSAGAQAATSSTFFTSFEKGDRPLTWSDAPEAGDCGLKAAAPARVLLAAHVATGPSYSMDYGSMPHMGFTGLGSLRYMGSQLGGGRGVACDKLFAVRILVTRSTQLSYMLYPEHTDDDLGYPSEHVAIDLAFTDGTRLSALHPKDSHGVPFTASGQGAGRALFDDQWNHVAVDVGAVAAGKTIDRILLAYDYPRGTSQFAGFVDDLRIADVAAPPADPHPSDEVDIRRGTYSNGAFSRGNTFPAVAVPFCFNSGTPTTQAGSDWIYQYAESNGPRDNLPRIQAFLMSHEPSPWMGDRQTFQIMPSIAPPTADVTKRALAFRHENEIAHPHYYRVRFENGLVAEMTPTDHAAMFRFTFPAAAAYLIFDNNSNDGGIALDPAARSISGYSDVKSYFSGGAPRMFFYAVFDEPVSSSGRLTGGGRDDVSAYFGFDTRSSRVVTMRIASSFISVDQARRNLEQEIGSSDTFESVESRAQQLWDRELGRIQVSGATHDQSVTLYSNLYRFFLYPNSAFENAGTPQQPDYRYASPVSPPSGEDTAQTTGSKVVSGKLYVNNGFWDTYRANWPLAALLIPHETGDIIDGFVQQYRDGGWIARWSSPGYADLMTGTSADVAFSDAWLRGVQNFDVRSFYQAALKDASVVSPSRGTGRKGLARSIFLGYTDDTVDQGLSWAMAGYVDDFGISQLAAALAAQHDPGDPYAASYADDARYFRNRSLGYVHLFDRDAGFFVGRAPDGSWSTSPADFTPYSWGGDYTETDAWNMAFPAPYDGQGLANIYGGREALAKKLDALFAAPSVFDVGEYGGVIHEMLEAQAVRMGQYGQSNEPSFHIIYMYDYAGEPWKTQDKVRDVLSRLYVGSEIGQGYLGDEDNGAMSAWWLFGAAGFYPLQVGTPAYVIGAPFFPHMTIHLENGKAIVINAPGVSDVDRYVQSLRVNGQPYQRVTIAQSVLARGCVLDFSMGPRPSRWGSAPADLPP